MSSSIVPSARLVIPPLTGHIFNASRVLFWNSLAMLGVAAVCVAAQQVDQRFINGVSIWLKPAKFHASLAIQFLTVAWAMQFLPENVRVSKRVRWSIVTMVSFGWLELAYITVRAARGEASHYNVADVVGAIAYPLMGLAAVGMTAIAGYVGFLLWRQRRDGIWTEAAALGLMFGAFLGTVAGAYVSAQLVHQVGGDATDATGTGLFAWSTTGGDLRVAHFVGLHAAQIIPMAALSGRRPAIYATAGLVTLLTAATFVQAYLGIPLMRG